MLIDWFTVLASEKLRQDAPFFQERLDYVYEPLSEVAASVGVEILGWGAALPPTDLDAAYSGPATPVPAVVFAWELPIASSVVFENGYLGGGLEPWMWQPPSELTNLQRARQEAAMSGVIERWLHNTGILDGLMSPNLQFLGQFGLIALPRPLAQAAPGEAAHCSGPAGPGTFGARVRSNGVDGFLTAGHVAPIAVPSAVYDSHSNLVGKITQRMCCDYDSGEVSPS